MQFCLTAPVATIICLGRDHEVHGNDAFAALIGVRGVPVRPAREVFGEQWAVLAPLVERAPAVAYGIRFVFEGVERVATVVTTRASAEAVVVTFIEMPAQRGADELLALLAGRGDIQLKRERVELSHVIDRALELSAGYEERILVSVPRSGVTLLADCERLANAISHLLVDAAENSSARVTIEGTSTADNVSLTIRCEGWAPIESLGRAITRALIRAHGGMKTWSENSVTIDLPAEAQALVRPPEHVLHRARNRVLVVEDNDDTARSLKTALEMLGYEVAIAHNGPVALTVARAFNPDVALLDIGLPVMDGYELAKRLRALATERSLPVVAVTAYSAESYRQRSAEAGFAEHLVKPADLGQLERVLDNLLEG